MNLRKYKFEEIGQKHGPKFPYSKSLISLFQTILKYLCWFSFLIFQKLTLPIKIYIERQNFILNFHRNPNLLEL